jgi:hypothetical protein
MRCAPTADGYNPTVLGLNVPAWKMDITFYNNLITIFTRDTTVANLPSVKAAWDALLFPPERSETNESNAVVEASTEPADFVDTESTPEPELEPELELTSEPAPEAAPVAEQPPAESEPEPESEEAAPKTVKVTVRKKVSKPAEEHFEVEPETTAPNSDSDPDLFQSV